MLVPRNRSVIVGAIIAVLLLTVALYAWAGITVAATGGGAISADTAATGGTGAWTTLDGPTYRETVNGDLAVGNSVTLTAPAGFEFNPATAVTVVLIEGDDRQAAANMNETPRLGNVASLARNNLSLTASTISFPVFSKSRGNTLNTIKWVGVQVRPLQGTPLATGAIRITVPPGSLSPSSPNAGTLTVVPGALARLHTVLPGQAFVPGTGVTGTAVTQTVGSLFNVMLVATDQFNNLITTYSGTKNITYAGPAATCTSAPSYTTSVNFTSGKSTTVLATTLFKAETTTITASEGGVVGGPASSALIVAPAAMSQLVVTLPGQTFTPCVGNTGTPADQAAGVPFTIASITATDNFFNVITTYAGAKTLAYSGPALPATYTTAVSFSAGKSTTTLSTTINTAQENTFIRVDDGMFQGPDSAKFSVKPTVNSFDAFDTATPVDALTGVIKTKISGGTFALDLVALTSTPAISKGFTGTVKVEIVDSASGAACGTLSRVQLLPDQTFTAGENGRHRVSGIIEAKALKNVRVRISQPAGAPTPTIVSCSTDNFSIRPDRFNAARASDATEATPGLPRTLSNTGLTGGLVHKTGRPFTIAATAAGPTGAAVTNYVGTVTAVMSLCSQPGCAPAGNTGVLLINTWTFNNGALTTNNATYSDVGAFTLVLEDRTFADVDASDSSPAERFITSSAFNVGRFVPDHFTAESGSIVPRTDINGCATSLFTYMDEPLTLSYKLVARSGALGNPQIDGYQGTLATLKVATPSHLNLGGLDSVTSTALVKPISAITQATTAKVTTSTAHGLQTGATVFVTGIAGMTGVGNSDKQYKVTVLDPSNFTIDADTASAGTYAGGGYASRLSVFASTGTWEKGAVTIVSPIMLQRLTAPDGPFNTLKIGIAPRDPDGVALLAFNLDADASGSDERFTVATTRFLFGRLKLGNAYGKAQLNMRIPLQTQFWTGTGFRQNGEDNCTAITSEVNVGMTDYRGGLSAAKFTKPESVLLGGAFNAGVGSLVLKPDPAPEVKGSVQISVNLDAEAKKYLKGLGAGTLYDKDPVSRATFGLYKSGPVIYVRETY